MRPATETLSSRSTANAGRDDNQKWVVIEDQHGCLASPSWHCLDQTGAEQAANHKNWTARTLDIRTRYHALPESHLLIVQQLLVCRRLGTDIDWRPTELTPEDYYLLSV